MQWLKAVLLQKLKGALWNTECPAQGFSKKKNPVAVKAQPWEGY